MGQQANRRFSSTEIDAFEAGWNAALSSFSGAWSNFGASLLNLMLCFIPRKKRRSKALSDAECAAHYWMCDSTAAGKWDRTYPTHDSSHPLWDDYLQAQKEADTWHRFATTPHAAEVDE